MSTTSQLTTFADLYTDLQNRVRVQTGQTATQNQAKRYINIALHDMHVGNKERFPWAERQATLVTHPEYTTGTVTITQGSTTLTGSGTAWDTNNSFGQKNARTTGRVIIAGTNEVYRIASVNSDTSITLDSRYVGSDVSAGSYTYFEDEYDLDSDFLRPFDFQFFDQNRSIKILGRREFRQRYPRSDRTGKILVASIIDVGFSGNTTPIRRVRFYRPPADAELINYNFITKNLAVGNAGAEAENMVSDEDEPIVPIGLRHAIVYHALAQWYRDKKDDSRSQEAHAAYVDLMLRIINEQEIGASRPQMRPTIGPYARAARRPWRAGRSRRFTLGTAFDEIRDR